MKWLKSRTAKSSMGIVVKQIALIFIALTLATLFLAISGYDAFAVVKGLFQGLTSDIAGTIRWATPLILAGLAIAVTYKAQFFNLGVDGQIYMGSVAGAAVALYVPVEDPFISLLLVFIAAMMAGAIFALIPAVLKIVWGTNEVVSTLLLNFVAVYFVDLMVTGPMKSLSATTNLNATDIFNENFWLPRLKMFEPSVANIGIIIAIVLAIVLAFVFFYTRKGLEIKIVGENSMFAKYSGIKPARTIITVMIMSGCIAGIIGVIEITAVQHRLLAGFNPGFGFDGIVVSLLANNNPIGVIFSGLFFGALENGGINMERITDVPSAVTDIVMAIVILTISIKIAFPHIKKWFNTKKSMKKPQQN